MIPGLQHKTFRSYDGTEIAYQVRGEGPAVVLANGLGGTFEAFRHVYSALGERYRVICWDYRGLYRSQRPRDLKTLGVPFHCRDLVHLLDHEGIERAVFIGWSMGVQINFEMFREQSRRVAGLVAINGTYGTPFRTALASRLTRYVVPAMLAVMKAQAPLILRASSYVVEWKGIVPLMARFGMVSTRVDAETMLTVAQNFKTIDFAVYSDILKNLGQHDARDLLTSIEVPTLIVTGDKDLFTPVFTARNMNRQIRGSRLVVIPGGTHYTPLEFPDLIEGELRRFLAGVPGWGAEARQRA